MGKVKLGKSCTGSYKILKSSVWWWSYIKNTCFLFKRSK